MNSLYFAVASVVDANTHYLGERVGDTTGLHQAQARAHRIRSRSLLALLHKLKNGWSARLARARAAAEKRRQLRELRRLDDRQLRDIGLHRGDLSAVELGLIELEQLVRERREKNRRVVAVAEPPGVGAAPATDRVAVNDPNLQGSRCA